MDLSTIIYLVIILGIFIGYDVFLYISGKKTEELELATVNKNS
ncbi:MAG: hypothetical protein Q8936_03695 [Bacillota bacterium]|nr:hypothetical protein [Bacillota bacterium]